MAEMWLSHLPVVQSQDRLDERSAIFRNVDGAGAAAIASVGMIVVNQLDAEGLFHGRRGTGHRDRATQDFVASLQHLQIVLGCELPDLVDLCGIGPVLRGKFGVTHGLAGPFG